MKFSLSDRSGWWVQFEADGPQDLRKNVARVWDARIERVRLDDRTTDPAFALAARLREINEWLATRRDRLGASDDQRRAWESQAIAWRQRARSLYGGDPGELRICAYQHGCSYLSLSRDRAPRYNVGVRI